MKKIISSLLALCLILAAAAVPAFAAEPKELFLTEAWQLTSDLDLEVPADTQLVIDGGGRCHIYEMGGKLVNTGGGTVYLSSTFVYEEGGTTPAAGSLAALSKAARALTVAAPAKDATALTLPANTAIKSSGNTSVITTAGAVTPPASATAVTLVLTITDASGNKADSDNITVTVPAKTPAPSGGGTSGIGSGGGDGGSSSSTTSETKPSGGGVSVSYTQSGGAVTVALPDAKVTELLGKSATVAEIDLSGVSNATSAALPKAALTKIADAGLAVEIALPQGSVTLDAEAAASVAEQAGGGNVSVALKSVTASTLNASQRAAAGGATVYDISVSSGSRQITAFGGASVTISLPYTLKSGETASGVAATYIGEKGETEKLPSSYDTSAKKVTFSTTHLSLYAIGYSEPSAAALPWVNPFIDVAAGDWFYADVEYSYTNGLMTGSAPNMFSPETPLSRAMLVTVLHRLSGTPASAAGTVFSDVPAGQWYSNAIAWASENGLVTGTGGDEFSPETELTRQDMAVLFTRYASFCGKTLPPIREADTFTDEAEIAGYAKQAVADFNRAGLIGGVDGAFDPRGIATRAQLAVMLHRYIEAAK
ncbi:MAG: S-layer homology domain-containing protein [Oscillospiraceae bacterium]|jgi:hypothetical protein|nr:S-layer homology domain-containing protein [Oscillospiraceae bacterium]